MAAAVLMFARGKRQGSMWWTRWVFRRRPRRAGIAIFLAEGKSGLAGAGRCRSDCRKLSDEQLGCRSEQALI